MKACSFIVLPNGRVVFKFSPFGRPLVEVVSWWGPELIDKQLPAGTVNAGNAVNVPTCIKLITFSQDEKATLKSR